MRKNCALVLTRMIDIPVFILLLKNLNNYGNFNCKIVIPDFYKLNEFNWPGKAKALIPNITVDHFQNMIGLCGSDNIIICSNEKQFKSILKQSELCIARGLIYAIFQQLCKKNIAISSCRVYFRRILDAMDYYQPGSLKIILQSEEWTKKESTGFFGMDHLKYNSVEKHKDQILYCTVINLFYDIMKSIGENNLKNALNVPADKKIAFVSLRMADSAVSFHRDKNEFLEKTVKMIKDFRDKDYWIIARRRKSLYDLNVARKDYPENLNYESHFKMLIDQEINGYEYFPSEVFCLPFVADVVLLGDFTGLATIESAIAKTPCYLPYEKNELYYKLMNSKEFSPIFKDMLLRDLITNNVNNLSKKEIFENNIENFLTKWYTGNMEIFWKFCSEY